jgi:hypothetical protein
MIMNEKDIDEMSDAELRQDLIELCAKIGVQMVESEGGYRVVFSKDGHSELYENDPRDLYITALYNLSAMEGDPEMTLMEAHQ